MTKSFLLFLRNATDKGMLLITATVLGLILINSQFASIYDGILHSKLEFILSSQVFVIHSHVLVNDFLMSIFFLIVGIEIKKEMISGHLASKSQRILPVICAIAGVIIPLCIYVILNRHILKNLIGWAIPTATDIAFVIAVMSMFSKKIPQSIRIFVTALAVIDDLIAVIAIAAFYTASLNVLYIMSSVICIIVLVFLNKKNVYDLRIYISIGILMLFSFYFSGIHATVAGVILGFCIPQSSSERITKSLQNLVTYFIMPVFAFFNSGVSVVNFSLNDIFNPIILGIAGGLFLGKQIGIFGSCYALIKSKTVAMPENANFYDIYVSAVLCGIGFTMSLFVAFLAFSSESLEITNAKVGILLGSISSFVYGCILLLFKKN